MLKQHAVWSRLSEHHLCIPVAGWIKSKAYVPLFTTGMNQVGTAPAIYSAQVMQEQVGHHDSAQAKQEQVGITIRMCLQSEGSAAYVVRCSRHAGRLTHLPHYHQHGHGGGEALGGQILPGPVLPPP